MVIPPRTYLSNVEDIYIYIYIFSIFLTLHTLVN